MRITPRRGCSSRTQSRAEEALIEAERSLRLNPGFIPSYLVLCQANLMLGLPRNAIEHARKVKRLSPPDPYLYVFHTQEGLAHIMLGEDGLAVACPRQAAANNPEFPAASGYLTAALALNGNAADAREQLARYLALPEARPRLHGRCRCARDRRTLGAR